MKLYLIARISGWRRPRDVIMCIVSADDKFRALELARGCLDTSDAVVTELVPTAHEGIVYKQHGSVTIPPEREGL